MMASMEFSFPKNMVDFQSDIFLAYYASNCIEIIGRQSFLQNL